MKFTCDMFLTRENFTCEMSHVKCLSAVTFRRCGIQDSTFQMLFFAFGISHLKFHMWKASSITAEKISCEISHEKSLSERITWEFKMVE